MPCFSYSAVPGPAHRKKYVTRFCRQASLAYGWAHGNAGSPCLDQTYLMMSKMNHSSAIVLSWPPTFCLSTELRQNLCHATLLSNMSLTIPFIPLAEPPSLPPMVFLGHCRTHHHNLLNTHVMITQPNHVVPDCHPPSYPSYSIRVPIFLEWYGYDFLFRWFCTTCSSRFSWHITDIWNMKSSQEHGSCRCWCTLIAGFIRPTWSWRPQVGPMLAPWNLLSGDAITASHYQHLTPKQQKAL